MGLFKNYVSQTRKPEGVLGKMMLNGMNSGHAKMADWGISHLKGIKPAQIAELGCAADEMQVRCLKNIRLPMLRRLTTPLSPSRKHANTMQI